MIENQTVEKRSPGRPRKAITKRQAERLENQEKREENKLRSASGRYLLPVHPLAERINGTKLEIRSPEDMETAIMAYVDWTLKARHPFLLTGFLLYTGLDKNELDSYSVIPAYKPLIKKVLLLAENYLNEYLIAGKPPIGALFLLKNHHGYKDKSEVEHRFTVTMNEFMEKVDNTAEKPPNVIEGEVVN